MQVNELHINISNWFVKSGDKFQRIAFFKPWSYNIFNLNIFSLPIMVTNTIFLNSDIPLTMDILHLLLLSGVSVADWLD